MSIRKSCLAACLLLLVAACGGGGGEDGADVRVSINGHSPASMQAEAYEGFGYAATMRVTFGGDLSALNGKTVYVINDVSGSVLQGTPSISFDDTEPYVDVTFRNAGQESAPAGVHEGTIKVYACLDPDCRTQLGNSPVVVPYKVTIRAGLNLSASSVDRDVAFGAKPAAARVAVALPEGTLEWSISGFTPTDGAFAVDKAADGSANVDISFAIATPGSRSETFQVTATAPSLDGQGIVSLQKWFTVTYNVQDSAAVPIAFDPSAASYEFSYGSSEQGHGFFNIASAEGTTERVGAVYFSAPQAAATAPKVNDWIWFDAVANEYFVLPCDLAGSQVSNCLPAGDYTGAIRFRHTSPGGAVTLVDYPVSMTIRP
jgi:hypothetical protein